MDWGSAVANSALRKIGSLFRSDYGMDESTLRQINQPSKEVVTYQGAFSRPNAPNMPIVTYKSIIETPEISRLNISAPSAPKRQASLDEYLAMGKTAAQWLAETGQQSTADAVGGYQNYERAVNEAKAEQARQMQTAAATQSNGTVSMQNYVNKAATNVVQQPGGNVGGVYSMNVNTQNPNALVTIGGQIRPANTLSELERALVLSGNAWGIKR